MIGSEFWEFNLDILQFLVCEFSKFVCGWVKSLQDWATEGHFSVTWQPLAGAAGSVIWPPCTANSVRWKPFRGVTADSISWQPYFGPTTDSVWWQPFLGTTADSVWWRPCWGTTGDSVSWQPYWGTTGDSVSWQPCWGACGGLNLECSCRPFVRLGSWGGYGDGCWDLLFKNFSNDFKKKISYMRSVYMSVCMPICLSTSQMIS